MGVVSVSSSASRASLGLSRRFTAFRAALKRPLILASKGDRNKSTALVAPSEHKQLDIKTRRDSQKIRRTSITKRSKRSQVASTAEVSSCSPELDFNEAAARLESIYKLSPATDASDAESTDNGARERWERRRKSAEVDENKEVGSGDDVVRNKMSRVRRLSLDKRIELKKNKEENTALSRQKKKVIENEEEKIEELVQEYSASTDLVSLDWKKMKIPPVLLSSEQAWLFRLMEPMKALLQVKENLQRELGRDPTDAELAEAMNMSVLEVRRHMEVGHAARNKLIKVRVEIQKAKLELMFELKRMPTDEEIMERVGISRERYHEVMKASNPVYSLHTKHSVTDEELIDGITDADGVGGDKHTHPAVLRLALDDVLDSLKPKESLVIRQRYGLDGKGDRTLSEIAGNLNISREMVRKYETKALMKLKHPARVDYLRRYLN